MVTSLPRCSSLLLVNTGFLSLVLFSFCKYSEALWFVHETHVTAGCGGQAGGVGSAGGFSSEGKWGKLTGLPPPSILTSRLFSFSWLPFFLHFHVFFHCIPILNLFSCYFPYLGLLGSVSKRKWGKWQFHSTFSQFLFFLTSTPFSCLFPMFSYLLLNILPFSCSGIVRKWKMRKMTIQLDYLIFREFPDTFAIFFAFPTVFISFIFLSLCFWGA